jgi:hypothetical protein
MGQKSYTQGALDEYSPFFTNAVLAAQLLSIVAVRGADVS